MFALWNEISMYFWASTKYKNKSISFINVDFPAGNFISTFHMILYFAYVLKKKKKINGKLDYFSFGNVNISFSSFGSASINQWFFPVTFFFLGRLCFFHSTSEKLECIFFFNGILFSKIFATVVNFYEVILRFFFVEDSYLLSAVFKKKKILLVFC